MRTSHQTQLSPVRRCPERWSLTVRKSDAPICLCLAALCDLTAYRVDLALSPSGNLLNDILSVKRRGAVRPFFQYFVRRAVKNQWVYVARAIPQATRTVLGDVARYLVACFPIPNPLPIKTEWAYGQGQALPLIFKGNLPIPNRGSLQVKDSACEWVHALILTRYRRAPLKRRREA